LLLSAALLILAPEARAGEMVVIVNKQNPTPDLNAKQAKNYFMRVIGEWKNGEKVRSVDQSGGGAVRDAFLAKLVGMSAGEFERYWIEKQYANAENPPLKAPDEATVIKLVATMKGSIGYVSKDAFAASKNDAVKAVLTVAH
jgi:ABC-type phosphate transport system substrate-binding protein